MPTLADRLTTKIGPLPAWLWAAIPAGGYVVWSYYRATRPVEVGLDGEPVADTSVDEYGINTGGSYLPSYGAAPGGTSNLPTIDAPEFDNETWFRQAANWLIGEGVASTDVVNALNAYLYGAPETLTNAQMNALQRALVKFGPAPDPAFIPRYAPGESDAERRAAEEARKAAEADAQRRAETERQAAVAAAAAAAAEAQRQAQAAAAAAEAQRQAIAAAAAAEAQRQAQAAEAHRQAQAAAAEAQRRAAEEAAANRPYEDTMPNLGIGSTGAAVARLQQWLRDFAGQRIAVDGYYGPQTDRAVDNLLRFLGRGARDPAAGSSGVNRWVWGLISYLSEVKGVWKP